MEKQKSNLYDKLIWILRASDTQCISCYSYNPNWLSEIQDILEERGIVEAFCLASKNMFYIKNERLRVHDCVSSEEIVDWIYKAVDSI